MNLESQVVSLELAKRLKELGVPQESLFYWGMISSDNGGNGNYCLFRFGSDEYEMCSFTASAFTVAELGEMLPWQTGFYKNEAGDWRIAFTTHPNEVYTPNNVYGDTEADARAKMLIYLIENGLVKMELEKQK